MVIAYNYSIVPIQDKQGNNAFDVYYFTKSSKNLNCIRVENIYLWMYIHRIPGYTIDQTLRFVQSHFKDVPDNDFEVEIRNNLRDSCYNLLETKLPEYVQVFSKSSNKLKKLKDVLTKDLVSHRKTRNDKILDQYDQIIDKYIETLFRDTLNTTEFENSAYWFCRVFDVPFAGFYEINESLLAKYENDYLQPLPNKVENVYYINANGVDEYMNEKLFDVFSKWNPPASYKATEMNNIIVGSYDIETYNRNENPDHTKPNQYIFCIGVSFFHMMENKPYRCYSILTKDLGDSVERMEVKLEEDKSEDLKYLEKPGMKFYKNIRDDYHVDNYTTYISVENEKELVATFIDILNYHSPHIIMGFNNFTFDDTWIYSRVQKYKDEMMNEYLKVFSTYNISDLSSTNTHLLPKFMSFDLKIEGKETYKNYTIRSSVIQSMDVYKMLLKADPSRFSSNGKLDTMLDYYNIKNPYDNKPLSKTGLSISDMFKYWDESKYLYEIAFYCLQDSWICATLLIERSTIVDKLGLATTTYTSFSDSIYKADGLRVISTTSRYAHKYGFAFMDQSYEKRGDMIKKNWNLDEENKIVNMGSKEFDSRIIVGGAVRNVHSYKCTGIVAADFSSMYPSQYRSSNIASSTRIDPDMIQNPSKYGLEILKKVSVDDMYGMRNIFYIKKI